jgi:hypothetical protein
MDQPAGQKAPFGVSSQRQSVANRPAYSGRPSSGPWETMRWCVVGHRHRPGKGEIAQPAGAHGIVRAKTVADEPAPVVTAVQERAIRVQLAAEAMRQDGWVWLPGRPLIAATASCWLSRDPAANT